MSEQLFRVQCRQCHSIEDFKTGHENHLDTIEKALPPIQGKTQIQVRSILKKHKIDHAEYGFALYVTKTRFYTR